MATSLAAQLRAVASIDADRLASHHGAPAGKSYLFTPAVAAAHDASAIYNIAATGFEELLQVDPAFEAFEDDLFSPASKGTDRMLLTQRENKRLGKTLDRCIRKMGKWITLKATAKCLEWLIRRFRVHELNVPALLEAFLPYHDSPYFPRILAILTLPKSLPLHHVLHPLQSSPATLDRSLLVRGMLPAKDPSLALLREVVLFLPAAAREGNIHPALLTFWTATMVDFLERVRHDQQGRSEELARVLTEGLLECLKSAQEDEQLGSAVLPALLLFVRTFQLGEAPYTALLAASSLPAGVQRAATVVLTLLAGAPENLQLTMPAAWVEAVQQPTLLDAVIDASHRANAQRGVAQLVACMLASPSVYHASLLHLLNAERTNSSIVQSAVDALVAASSTPSRSAADTEAGREVLHALSQRHDVQIDGASFAGAKKRSRKSAGGAGGPDGSTSDSALADIYAANVSQRVQGIAAVLASADDMASMSTEAAASAAEGILARIGDEEDRVIDALYAKPAALFALVPPAKYLQALWPIMSDPETYHRQTRIPHVRHLKELRKDELFAGARLQFELFRVVGFPLLLKTKEDKTSTELVLRENHVRNTSSHDVLRESGSAQDDGYWARIAANIIRASNQQTYVTFLLAQSDAGIAALALTAHLLLTEIMLQANPEMRLALSQGVLKTASSNLAQALGALSADDFARLGVQRRKPLLDEVFNVHEHPIVRVLTAEALLMTLSQVNAPAQIAWLGGSQSAVQDGYRDFAINLYATVNNLRISNEAATSLLRSLLWRLGETALAFFAAVWTHPDSAIGTQYAALQHSAAFVRAFDQAAGQDFQCVVPSVLFALGSSNKQIRGAGITLLHALLDHWVAIPSDVYGAKDIYGTSSSYVRLLRASDYKVYLQRLLINKQDITISAEAVVETHRQMLDGGSRQDENAGTKWRKHLLTFIGSHIAAWRNDGARTFLLGIFGSSMDKAKLQALQPFLQALSPSVKRDRQTSERKWLEMLSLPDLEQVLASLFAPMDKAAARYIVRDCPELLVAYEQIISVASTSVAGYTLRSAAIRQMQSSPFTQMTIGQQVDFVEALLVSYSSTSTDPRNITRETLQSLPVSSSLTVEVLHRLQAKSGVSDTGSLSKKPRTENQASADSWTSLMAFLESRVAADSPGDESVLVACIDLLSSVLAVGSSIDGAASNHMQQVLLRWMARIAENIKVSGRPIGQTIGVEVIVKLIRGSPNPRTAQDALLLLGSLASFSPDAVLHNIMPVFTYMGSDEMQRDDAHSIAVVEKTIESIVPVLLDTHRRQGAKGMELVICANDLLQIFAEMAQRLPRHRAVPFFVHLVRVMGADVFLGPIEMLLVERFVRQARLSTSKSAANFNSSLPFLLESQFSTSQRLSAIAMIAQEISQLRADPEARQGSNSFFAADTRRPGLESDEARISLNKQLASYVNKVLLSVSPTAEHRAALKAITETLVAEAARRERKSASKQEHALDLQLVQAAQSALSLLPAVEMVDVCLVMTLRSVETRALARRVLLERLPTVRRDVREAISLRITDVLDHYVSIIASVDHAELSAVLQLLLAIAKPAVASEDVAISRFVPLLLERYNQGELELQANLDILAFLAEMPKRLGPRLIPHLRKLFAICLTATEPTSVDARPGMASYALKVAAAAIAHLPGFLPQADLSAVVLACVKPSPVDISEGDSVLAAVAKHVKGQAAFHVLFDLWAQLRSQNIANLQRYFKLLQKIIRAADRTVLPSVMKPLFNLYLEAFDLAAPSGDISAKWANILDAAIESFVDLVVKLNEATFKPLLGRLHDWAVVEEANKGISLARHATLYRVLERLLRKFQAIMLPYLSLVESDMTDLLQAYQRGQQDDGNLWLSMIALLGRSFDIRSGNFWTTEKLTVIIPALADQTQVVPRLSVPMETATEGLVAMFVSLAQLASSSEVLLKILNTAILLQTRADETATRLAALQCLKAIWQKNGEDMISLVPETVAQFLSELMEDEHSDVEKVAREVLTVIEGFVGDLQGYLT